MDFSEMWNKFNEVISLITDEKRNDKSFVNNEEDNRHIEKIKLSKIKTKFKQDYRNICKYNVILINRKGRFIIFMILDNNGLRYYVKNEDLFNILLSLHAHSNWSQWLWSYDD